MKAKKEHNMIYKFVMHTMSVSCQNCMCG